MEELIRTMMDMIASEVCGKAIDRSKYKFTDDYLVCLYKLSKVHDIAHLVGDALIKMTSSEMMRSRQNIKNK